MSLLRSLYDRILIGDTVYHEVVEDGRKIGAPEIVHVERAIDEEWMLRSSRTPGELAMTQRFLATTRLHEGEAEALAMASSRNSLLLADDKEARRIAHALGVRRIGTAGVLLEGCLTGHLTMSELEDAIAQLTSVSWQSPEVMAMVLRRAREAKP